MVLARKYTQAKDNDYEGLVAAAGRLRAILDALADDTLPPEYDVSILVAYCSSLLATQRTDGSFSTSLTPESLDADVSTDAHRFVTWVSASLLNLLILKYPAEVAAIPELEESISRALNSPVAGNFFFPESGPAETVQQVEAVLILSAGGLPASLKSKPSRAPLISAGLELLISEFRRRLVDEDTVLPGGIDYKLLFEQATATNY